ncbi:MAG: hypothetical protein K0S07_1417, partial [Chlamydiales bacterium]|nr:hypothetical protein [Chlamydiales bacterium]
VTVPKTIWEGVSYASGKIYRHLLAPVGQAIGTALNFAFVTVPQAIWQGILQPIFDSILKQMSAISSSISFTFISLNQEVKVFAGVIKEGANSAKHGLIHFFNRSAYAES